MQIQITLKQELILDIITNQTICVIRCITTFVRILCASCSNFPLSWNLKLRFPLTEPLLLSAQTQTSQSQRVNSSTPTKLDHSYQRMSPNMPM